MHRGILAYYPLAGAAFDQSGNWFPLRQALACSGGLLLHIPFATDTGEDTD